MSLFNVPWTRTHLLSYNLIFDSENRLGITVDEVTPPLSNTEYIRLWAFYQAELASVLNYPKNIEAVISLAFLDKIVEEQFDAGTDCFALAGLSEEVTYTEEPISGALQFTGKLFAKGVSRILVADFPVGIMNKYAIYGGIGLLQYTINRCSENTGDLLVAYNTARNLPFLLRNEGYGDQHLIKTLPDTAYALAAGSFNEVWRQQ